MKDWGGQEVGWRMEEGKRLDGGLRRAPGDKQLLQEDYMKNYVSLWPTEIFFDEQIYVRLGNTEKYISG